MKCQSMLCPLVALFVVSTVSVAAESAASPTANATPPAATATPPSTNTDAATPAANPAPREREIFHLSEDEKHFGYAQAVRIGNMLYLSGTTGRGATLEEQLRNAYGKIRKTLDHFNVGFDDIVKETIFTTDIEALKAAQPSRKPFYGEHTPASSWIGIDRLFVPELKLEIEVIVALD